MKAIFKGVVIAVLAVIIFVAGVFVGRSRYEKPCNPRYEFLSEVCEELRTDWERGVGLRRPDEPVDINKVIALLKIKPFSSSYPQIVTVTGSSKETVCDMAFDKKEVETDYGSRYFLHIKGEPYLLALHGHEGESAFICGFKDEISRWIQKGGGVIVPIFITDYAKLEKDASSADLSGQTLLGRRVVRIESIVKAVAGKKRVVALAHSSGSIYGLIWSMLSDRVSGIAVDYNYGGLSGACELGLGPSFYIRHLKQTLPMNFSSFFKSKGVNLMEQPYSYVDRDGLNKWLDEEFLKAKKSR